VREIERSVRERRRYCDVTLIGSIINVFVYNSHVIDGVIVQYGGKRAIQKQGFYHRLEIIHEKFIITVY